MIAKGAVARVTSPLELRLHPQPNAPVLAKLEPGVMIYCRSVTGRLGIPFIEAHGWTTPADPGVLYSDIARKDDRSHPWHFRSVRGFVSLDEVAKLEVEP